MMPPRTPPTPEGSAADGDTATTLKQPPPGASIVLGCLSILVPLLLELTGVIPPSMVFRDDGILLVPEKAYERVEPRVE